MVSKFSYSDGFKEKAGCLREGEVPSSIPGPIDRCLCKRCKPCILGSNLRGVALRLDPK